MPLVMAGFRQAHPQVQLQLQVAVPQEVSALVLRGEVDLALKYSTAPEKGLQVLHSAIAPIYAVMPAQHPLARQRSVSVADVVRYPLLLGAANTTGRQLFDLSCAVQGLRYVPAVESNFSSALLPLLSGQDVVLASYLTAARWVEAGLLAARPFDEAQLQQRRSAGAGRWRAGSPSALVQQFTQALVVAIEEYGKRKVGRRRKAAAARVIYGVLTLCCGFNALSHLDTDTIGALSAPHHGQERTRFRDPSHPAAQGEQGGLHRTPV